MNDQRNRFTFFLEDNLWREIFNKAENSNDFINDAIREKLARDSEERDTSCVAWEGLNESYRVEA